MSTSTILRWSQEGAPSPRPPREPVLHPVRVAIPHDLRDTYDRKVEIFAALGTSDRRDAEILRRRRALQSRKRATRKATEADIAHLAAKW